MTHRFLDRVAIVPLIYPENEDINYCVHAQRVRAIGGGAATLTVYLKMLLKFKKVDPTCENTWGRMAPD